MGRKPECKKCHKSDNRYNSQCYDNDDLYDYLRETGQCRRQSKRVCLNRHFYGPYMRPCRTTDPCMSGKLSQVYHGINELCNYDYDDLSDSDGESEFVGRRKCVSQCVRQCSQQNVNNMVNLVSNISGIANNVDPSLLNAWDGTMFNDNIYVTSNNSGSVISYNKSGSRLQQKSIPQGSPTGIVSNVTGNFVLSDGLGSAAASLIVSTSTGRIFGWNQFVNSGEFLEVVDNSGTNASYTDLEIVGNRLYAVDRQNGRVDVFSSTFAQETGFVFADPDLPAGYSPYGISSFNDMIYVTYISNSPALGTGVVNVFNSNGGFVRRFATEGSLFSPYDIIAMPTLLYNAHNDNTYGNMLVSNTGNGLIGVYDSNGNYKGTLKNANGNDVMIAGLRSLFTSASVYFVAGNSPNYSGLLGTFSYGSNNGYNNEFTQINSFVECCPKKKNKCFTIYKSIRECKD